MMEITTKKWLQTHLDRYLYRKVMREAYRYDSTGMLANLKHKRTSFMLALSAVFDITQPTVLLRRHRHTDLIQTKKFWMKIYMDNGILLGGHTLLFDDYRSITLWEILAWFSKLLGRTKPKFK